MENESPEQGIAIIADTYEYKMIEIIQRIEELGNELVGIIEQITIAFKKRLHNDICFVDELTYYSRDSFTDRTYGFSLVPRYKSQVLNRRPLFIRARSNC